MAVAAKLSLQQRWVCSLGVKDVTAFMGLEMEAAAEEIKAEEEEEPNARPDDGQELEEVEGAKEVDVALDKTGGGGEARSSNDKSALVTVETLKDA